MNKFNQNLIAIEGAVVLSLLFVKPTILFITAIFGPIDETISIGDIGTRIPPWVDAFFFAFPFFLTLIEFFFKKSFFERRPYLYIAGFFVLLSFFDNKLLLVTIAMIIISISPGTLYHWIKDKKTNPSR